MVVGHVQQSTAAIMLVTSHEIIVRSDRHVGSRNRNIFIARDVSAGRVVYLIDRCPWRWGIQRRRVCRDRIPREHRVEIQTGNRRSLLQRGWLTTKMFEGTVYGYTAFTLISR